MQKPLRFTHHGADNLKDRELSVAWVEQVARTPDWVSLDPRGQNVERRYGSIADADGRILRVVCVETPSEIRVITTYFDRDALRRKL